MYYQILKHNYKSQLFTSFVDALLAAIVYAEFEIVEVSKGNKPKLLAKREL